MLVEVVKHVTLQFIPNLTTTRAEFTPLAVVQHQKLPITPLSSLAMAHQLLAFHIG
jgi:hypothetical protein